VTAHHLDPTSETVTQIFSASAPAVVSVNPGDTLIVRTLDAHGYLERPKSWDEQPPRMFTPYRGHCLAGPIEVRGAEPGQVLAVHIESMRPEVWGWTTAGLADEDLSQALGVTAGPVASLVWDLDPDRLVGRADGFTVPLTPFLGVIGMPPPEPGEHSTTPPRALGGGNIDCRELVAGSTLYLPVTVAGAALCLGDGHAAQGDGEVGGTAIECGMTSTITVSLVNDPPLPTIHATTPAGRITFGFSAELNEAMTSALNAMVTWMTSVYDTDRARALALASVAVSLRVTQVANKTWGVHALLPSGALRRADPSSEITTP
jgi:acetamidase/formamidase